MATKSGGVAEDAQNELYERLLDDIKEERAAVLRHPVYDCVRDIASLREFMKSHVFAVWDNMTLLKSLQRRLTCVDLPWLPPEDSSTARLVNEIVLTEETDDLDGRTFTSHVELYIMAMDEVGADSSPIRDFISTMKQGSTPDHALQPLPVPAETKRFVLDTLETAEGPVHKVAASFFLGREDLATPMFQRLIDVVIRLDDVSCDGLIAYANRHVVLDEGDHAPMAKQLLFNVCGSDSGRWAEATEAARRALKARCSLWDGIVASVGLSDGGG